MKLHSARFYAILDTAYVSRAQWRATGAALIAGGADLVQVRAKRETARERTALVKEVLSLFEPVAGVLPPHLIVNDDVELCAATPGAGLHIGQDDMPPVEARRQIGPGRLLGLSTHSLAQAQAALALPTGVLDYFCIGPVFATQTKPDYEPVGLDLVRQVAALRAPLPWFAIGGINLRTINEVTSAGSERIVVVSEVLKAGDPAAAIRQLRAELSATPGGEKKDRPERRS